MNKTELIAAVAAKTGITKKDAENIISLTFDTIAQELSKGEKVQVSGFGIFEVKHREARVGRNPHTFQGSRFQGSQSTEGQGDKMRLDKYLKVSRLIKRRTVANEACDNGRISVNGRVVKASYDVKVGDKLEITMGPRTVAVEVLVVADNVRKDDACAMYKEI